MTDYGTKYPLQISCSAGRTVMERFGLKAEAPTLLSDEVVDPVADLIVSAHAPYSANGVRLSIADADDRRRRASIDAILAYIDGASRRFPNLRRINMHASPKRFVYEQFMLLGKYERLIDAIREIGAFAEPRDLDVVVENNRAYWEGVPEDVPVETVDRREQNDYFGTAPEEWIRIQKDVDRENVFLCLDSSHACTHAQTFPDEAREQVMRTYLDAGDALRHVHWNGNMLHEPIGRMDTHMNVGADDMPDAFHRAIKRLDATLLLEHFYTEEKLEAELAYVDAL